MEESLSMKKRRKVSAANCAQNPAAARIPSCTYVNPYSLAKGTNRTAVTLAMTAWLTTPARQTRAVFLYIIVVFPLLCIFISYAEEKFYVNDPIA